MPKIKVVCRYGVEYSLLARGIQEEVERLKYRLSKCCCYVCYNCSSCKIHKTMKQECMNECEISGIRFCEPNERFFQTNKQKFTVEFEYPIMDTKITAKELREIINKGLKFFGWDIKVIEE